MVQRLIIVTALVMLLAIPAAAQLPPPGIPEVDSWANGEDLYLFGSWVSDDTRARSTANGAVASLWIPSGGWVVLYRLGKSTVASTEVCFDNSTDTVCEIFTTQANSADWIVAPIGFLAPYESSEGWVVSFTRISGYLFVYGVMVQPTTTPTPTPGPTPTPDPETTPEPYIAIYYPDPTVSYQTVGEYPVAVQRTVSLGDIAIASGLFGLLTISLIRFGVEQWKRSSKM
ncbi:MAG: hypothetical protein KC496_20410 [Anaerolineae bacterium]|nr:hypothetical protein [Anaerolineae bacterium]